MVYGKPSGRFRPDGADRRMAKQRQQAGRGTGKIRPTAYVLNGPNLNLLGKRQPEIYGRATLADVEALCRQACDALGLGLVFRPNNHAGQQIGSASVRERVGKYEE